MFTNYNCCYMNNWYVGNQQPYLKITNDTVYIIFFILQYTLDEKTITTKTPVFNPSKKERLNFPKNAINVCFNILRFTHSEPIILFNGTILRPIPTCFKISMTSSGINCVQIPC